MIRTFTLIFFLSLATQAYCQEDNPFRVVEEVRTWNSSNGLFSVRAELKEFRDGVVHLSTSSGKHIEVPLEKLSETDQRYVKNEAVATIVPAAYQLLGKVIGVADGDTVTVLDSAKSQHTIRLEGIDAPEGHQAFGAKSKLALSDKVFGKAVRVDWKERDKYKRILGHVFVDDRWINKEMVEEGWAWHYKEYSSDKDLAKAEIISRSKHAGLWIDLGTASPPVPPWDFRHGVAAPATVKPNTLLGAAPTQAASQDSVSDPTVYITRTGAKYHSGSCSSLSKSRIPIRLSEASGRYSPCSRCNPPNVSAQNNASTSGSTQRVLTQTEEGVASVTVYITKTGEKYHSGGCRYLSKSRIPISLEDAKRGYNPCSVCGPP